MQRQQRGNGTGDGVTCLTMHGAKGLEYEVVFVIESNEGVTPYKKAGTPEELEEERRLFYVAITRTKNTTYLMVPTTNYSIFIKELERDYKRSKLVKFERLL